MAGNVPVHMQYWVLNLENFLFNDRVPALHMHNVVCRKTATRTFADLVSVKIMAYSHAMCPVVLTSRFNQVMYPSLTQVAVYYPIIIGYSLDTVNKYG